MTEVNANGKAKSVRVLVVDDYEPWKRFTANVLRTHSLFEIAGQASDGQDAVQEAEKLQPDLVLLDVGLPRLNGIQAIRRILAVSPASRVLMVSQSQSAEVTEAALSMGARGYVVKSDAVRDLLPAINAVLSGEKFLSASISLRGLISR